MTTEKKMKIEGLIAMVLSEDPEDLEEIQDYLASVEDAYGEDIYEFAFREAIRQGAFNYVEEHADEFIEEDDEYGSSYLDETDDEDIIELLMDHGANRSMEDYSDCRFAFETVNGEILAFDDSYRTEIFARYLDYMDLTEQDVANFLNDGDASDEDSGEDAENERNLADDLESLGISTDGEALVFEDLEGEDGYAVREILEALGVELEFEGVRSKLQVTGAYFVR